MADSIATRRRPHISAKFNSSVEQMSFRRPPAVALQAFAAGRLLGISGTSVFLCFVHVFSANKLKTSSGPPLASSGRLARLIVPASGLELTPLNGQPAYDTAGRVSRQLVRVQSVLARGSSARKDVGSPSESNAQCSKRRSPER